MSKLQVHEAIQLADKRVALKRPWWRILTLCSLFSLSVIIYILLIHTSPQNDDPIAPFLHVWMISFLPYFAACAFVLATKPLAGEMAMDRVRNNCTWSIHTTDYAPPASTRFVT